MSAIGVQSGLFLLNVSSSAFVPKPIICLDLCKIEPLQTSLEFLKEHRFQPVAHTIRKILAVCLPFLSGR
jgi:hypothetical protein